MHNPHKNPDIVGEAQIMNKGRLVKVRFPEQAAPNVGWFWFPIGNCHACKFYAQHQALCTNPNISRDDFLHKYSYLNSCPKFEVGIDDTVVKDNPGKADALDVMKAVGLVKGTPAQEVKVIVDKPWSIDLTQRAHREQSIFLEMALDAGNTDSQARGESVDWESDLESQVEETATAANDQE